MRTLRRARWWGQRASSPSCVSLPLGEPNLYDTVTNVPVLTDDGSSTGSARPLSPDADSFFWKEGKHEKHESSSSGGSKGKRPTSIRRSASLSFSTDVSRCASPNAGAHRSVDTVLVQIGTSDHEGWMRKKGGSFNKWRNRFLVLKGSHLYWLESDSLLVCVTWLAVRVIPSCLMTLCRPRPRAMLTLSAVELFQTRTLTLGHMGSNYCVGRIAPTFSAQMTKRLSANG